MGGFLHRRAGHGGASAWLSSGGVNVVLVDLGSANPPSRAFPRHAVPDVGQYVGHPGPHREVLDGGERAWQKGGSLTARRPGRSGSRVCTGPTRRSTSVARGGGKQWIQRIVVKGRRRDIGLGPFPVARLTDAREMAFENRRLVRNGGDPLAERRRASAPTFREATRRVFEANRPRWRNGKHAASWLQTLERHAHPVLGDLPVDAIGCEEVLAVLTPIWGTRQETARRVRQRIRTVLGWAMAHGYAQSNAAGEGIDGALPSMPAVKRHYRALPYGVAAGALETVDAGRASEAAKLCLRFAVLTAARSSEARGATWDEIDLDACEWRIPPDRMKAGTEHRVPLAPRRSKCSETRGRSATSPDCCFRRRRGRGSR